MDTTKVSVLGTGKRKIATVDRRGRPVDRYEVRWRAYLRAGGQHDYRRRFDRAADADEFIRRIKAVGLVGATWQLDADGQPVDAQTTFQSTPAACSTTGATVWSALLAYRSATWRSASGNGRKAAAPTLRAMARILTNGAPSRHPAMDAYLELIAFRSENELWDLAERVVEKVDHDGTWFSAADLEGGRRFLERWSLPLAELDRTHVRRLIAQLGHGRSAATEGRRWAQMRAVLNWWRDEGLIEMDLTSRLGVIRGTSVPRLGDDEAIPDEREMWRMGWALCL